MKVEVHRVHDAQGYRIKVDASDGRNTYRAEHAITAHQLNYALDDKGLIQCAEEQLASILAGYFQQAALASIKQAMKDSK